MDGTAFAFDLDGTITSSELLPEIAKQLHIQDEMRALTQLALEGAVDFDASFRQRFGMLRGIAVSAVREVVRNVPLNPFIERFIRRNARRCYVVTGNLDCWIEPLVGRLGCRFFSSTSAMVDGMPTIRSVLRKGPVIRKLAGEYSLVVAIGESVNDIPMFEEADIGIAFGGVHEPAPALVRLADYVVHDGETLCRILETL
jgi:HAD superfamily phosphoserine phosphatase-like hydrolase